MSNLSHYHINIGNDHLYKNGDIVGTIADTDLREEIADLLNDGQKVAGDDVEIIKFCNENNIELSQLEELVAIREKHNTNAEQFDELEVAIRALQTSYELTESEEDLFEAVLAILTEIDLPKKKRKRKKEEKLLAVMKKDPLTMATTSVLDVFIEVVKLHSIENRDEFFSMGSLIGEIGELANVRKKMVFYTLISHFKDVIDTQISKGEQTFNEMSVDEAGDVLFYVVQWMVVKMNIDLSAAINHQIQKLDNFDKQQERTFKK